jgi:hypothetical protein
MTQHHKDELTQQFTLSLQLAFDCLRLLRPSSAIISAIDNDVNFELIMEPEWLKAIRILLQYILFPLAFLAKLLLYLLYLLATPLISVARVIGNALILPVRILAKIITTFEVRSRRG